jgi:hypothetical protein
MQTMVWVRRAELRRFARVPIINLVHKNGVECDVSLDMSAEATSVVVAHLKERCGPALFTLSAFLKVYLGQLGLDAPFTGGLGSYKLYVLLAKHLLQQSAETGNDGVGTAQVGPLLLSFLKHYGTWRNLNKTTVVEVDGADPVNFAATMRIDAVCGAFSAAHEVLSKSSGKGSTGGAAKASSGAAAVVVPRNNPHSFLSSQLSHSHLAPLLNTAHLCQQRAESRRVCQRFPQRTSQEREAVARGVLQEMNRRLDLTSSGSRGGPGLLGSAASYEEVVASNPALAARLRSFASVSSAVGHLAGLTESQRSRDLQEQFNISAPAPVAAPVSASVAATVPAMAVGSSVSASATPQAQVAAPGPAVLVPAATTSGTAAPLVVAVPDDPAVLRTIKQLEAALLTLLLQSQQPPVFFDPASLEGQAVVSGDRALDPFAIFVKKNHVNALPAPLRDQLGPFACLALAQRYLGKTAAQVRSLQEKEEAAEQRVQAMFRAGLLSDQRGPEERAFLRRCYIAGVMTAITLVPKLSEAEIRVLSVSKASRAVCRSYIPQSADRYGAVELKALVQTRFEDQRVRAAERKLVPVVNTGPVDTSHLPEHAQHCIAAHAHLEKEPVAALVERLRGWARFAARHQRLQAEGNLRSRNIRELQRKGQLPVPPGAPFTEEDWAARNRVLTAQEGLQQYVRLRVEREGKGLSEALASKLARASSLLDEAARSDRAYAQGAGSGKVVIDSSTASKRGRQVGCGDGETDEAEAGSAESGVPSGKRARTEGREVVDLTAADSNSEGEGEGWDGSCVEDGEVAGGVTAAAERRGASEDRADSEVLPAGFAPPSVLSPTAPTVLSPAAPSALSLAPALEFNRLPPSADASAEDAQGRLEVPSLSKPSFGRRRATHGAGESVR